MRARWTSPLLAIALAGCASVSLTDESAKFATDASKYTGVLKEQDGERLAAKVEAQRAVAEGAINKNAPIRFDVDCRTAAVPAFDAWNKVLSTAYDPGAADASYAGFRVIKPCSLIPSADAPPDKPSLPASAATDPSLVSAVGADTLAEAASALDDYVTVVVDIVSNKSGAKQDAALTAANEAAGKLLEAVGLKNAGAAAGVSGQLVASAIAAERNSKFGAKLQRMDAVMPYILERIGHAGRLTVVQALSSRLDAAQLRAADANAFLSQATNAAEKARTFALIAPALDRQNEAIVRLRGTDPMIAARRFAEAHKALIEAYVGKKGQTPALSSGFKSFSKAAGELAKALTKKDS